MGPWNMLSCRANSFFTLSLGQQNANGVVVGFDIYPYSGASSQQTIFAFRDTVNLAVSFAFEINTDGTVAGISCSSGTCSQVFVTSVTVNWSNLTIFKQFVLRI